jgi:hypothetical protein
MKPSWSGSRGGFAFPFVTETLRTEIFSEICRALIAFH